MKIAPKAAEGFLGSPAREHRACLLYGPDSGLARERAKRMATTLLPGSDDPFALTELTEAAILADPARLSDELSAISMLSPKRVILIRDGGDKLTKIIESAADAFHDSVFLIVCADELSPRSSLRVWFEKDSRVAALACYRDEARDIQEVVRRSFDAAGLRAPREVTEYLTQQLGNDRGVTNQELDKLITYAGEDKTLTLDDARALVDYNREGNLDDVVNAVADRNVQALDAMLAVLLREGTMPVVYLRALQRYFNRLYYIRAQMASGRSADEVISGLRPPVFFRQVPILSRHVQGWSTDAIVRALKLLIAAELASKTSDVPAVAASSRRLLQVTQVR